MQRAKKKKKAGHKFWQTTSNKMQSWYLHKYSISK